MAAVAAALESVNSLGVGNVTRVSLLSLHDFNVQPAEPLPRDPVTKVPFWASMTVEVDWETDFGVGGGAVLTLRRGVHKWEGKVLRLAPRLVGPSSEGVRRLKEEGGPNDVLREAIQDFNNYGDFGLQIDEAGLFIEHAEVSISEEKGSELEMKWSCRVVYPHPATSVVGAEAGITMHCERGAWHAVVDWQEESHRSEVEYMRRVTEDSGAMAAVKASILKFIGRGLRHIEINEVSGLRQLTGKGVQPYVGACMAAPTWLEFNLLLTWGYEGGGGDAEGVELRETKIIVTRDRVWNARLLDLRLPVRAAQLGGLTVPCDSEAIVAGVACIDRHNRYLDLGLRTGVSAMKILSVISTDDTTWAMEALLRP